VPARICTTSSAGEQLHCKLGGPSFTGRPTGSFPWGSFLPTGYDPSRRARIWLMYSGYIQHQNMHHLLTSHFCMSLTFPLVLLGAVHRSRYPCACGQRYIVRYTRPSLEALSNKNQLNCPEEKFACLKNCDTAVSDIRRALSEAQHKSDLCSPHTTVGPVFWHATISWLRGPISNA
jgi:hypothetical protein